ncbi:MAG: hypothetical protein MUC36_24070 [Planctomycetes bacterium]|jgi:hypothetical protein|nr:hypothetical protein [Planctomycetota bacterium]
MKQFSALALVLLAAGLAAQSNTVPGLNGRLTIVDDLTYWGRRGPAHPNGEVGMSMLNEMCNPGSVNIPWQAPMQPNHPKFGFLICRVAGGRIEQINEWSFCKHAFVSVNVNGSCGTCIDPGTGSLMGLNCSDTYGAGNNADRFWLGPPREINPWLGTWNPVGSYFDIGDPAQAGYPAAADGVRSLSQNIFDAVQNRVTVDEVDLLTPGASYFYGLQLIHQGEAVTVRGDNLAHRGFTPSWSGGNWTFANNAAQQVYGSILDRWPGATVNVGGNGNDDGRFYVAVKTTSIGGGRYHYEYAVHNVDNSRAGATFRLPIAANAVANNFSFRDIDKVAGNDWSAARVGNELVFSASANNPLEWNTIYNFGFDADIAPGTGTSRIDEARPGPGQLTVDVPTLVPGGQTVATYAVFGAGCPGSTQIQQPPCAQFNAAGGAMTLQTSPNEYVYRVATTVASQVLSFDIWTASTGGTVTVPAHLYAISGSTVAATPIASTTITVGPTQGFYRATFAQPVTVTGSFCLGVDSSAQTVHLSNVAGASQFPVYSRPTPTSAWTLSLLRPAFRVNCVQVPQYQVPALTNSALPVLGTSYDVRLAQALPSSQAVLVSGRSSTDFQGLPLPAPVPFAPGCNILVEPYALNTVATSATGTASYPISVPNTPSLAGFVAYHQWVVLDLPANIPGIAVSNASTVTVGY